MSRIKNKNGITVRDFYEDFSDVVEKEKKIIIFVTHGISYAKEYSFMAYTNKIFNRKKEKYFVACKHLPRIEYENMKPIEVINAMQKDVNEAYDEFLRKYPDAKLEKPSCVNFAIDASQDGKRAEFMAIALKRIDENYSRTQFSPIIPRTIEQYKAIRGEDDSKEGQLLRDLVTEKRTGIEQYGIGGYLSNGKLKTYDMFMQSLLDIVPNYKDIANKKRRKVVYANYRVNMRAYMYSIRTEEENAALEAQENETII